ncbi:hypothetical protein ABT288_49585 [Streptomyces sp. NPDC001093]|uniref:hypothetical protein n=1 Tax=Streptomyces sp. NPDC001093 TaxID=3154376 RepID=UPI0033237063
MLERRCRSVGPPTYSVLYITGDTSATALSPSGSAVGTVLLVEFLFTFALAYVMLNVATSADRPHNGFYGVARRAPRPQPRTRLAQYRE